MYLKSVKIENFRKFGSENNIVSFASDSQMNGESKSLNSTLIVGQNNAGKTSVIKALEKASKESFSYTDFNYYYLKDLLENAIQNKEKIKIYIEKSGNVEEDDLNLMWSFIPYITILFDFHVEVGNDSKDLLTNIGPIITNDIPDDGMVSCFIKYETKNLLTFVKSLYEIISKDEPLDNLFGDFLHFLESFSNEYEVNCYININEPEVVIINGMASL